MEIIIGLVFLVAVAAWIYYRTVLGNDHQLVSESKDSTLDAPYKIETPAPKAAEPAPVPAAEEPRRCGCGRSASGFCVGLHALSMEQWAEHPDNPRRTTPAVKKTKARKPAVKKDKAPVATTAPAKKPAAKTSTKAKAKAKQ